MAERGAIRAASADDSATIAAITHAAYEHWIDLLGGEPIPVTEDYGPRIEKGEVFILERLGQPAGLLVAETQGDHVMIFSVAVAPEFQGLGFGVHLLRYAEDLARKAGVGEVRLYTNARMDKNIALYKSFGYHETGRRKIPARPGWTVVDMAKEIG